MIDEPMPKRMISLTTPALRWLRAESRRLGLSASELVRRAIDRYRGETPGRAPAPTKIMRMAKRKTRKTRKAKKT